MKFSLLIIAATFLGSALPAYAAELIISQTAAASNTTFAIPITLEANTDDLNVVEGTLYIPEDLIIERIDTSGSLLTVFASGPAYSRTSHTIEFTGGSPQGLAQKNGLLFTIHARAQAPGTYEIAPKNISGYKNDGAGTLVVIPSRTTVVTVGKEGSAPALEPRPSTSPLTAEIGRDDSLFEGKWFVAFYGGDAQEYFVKEGWFGKEEHAERYYVLKDQNRTSTVRVMAVREDGTKVSIKLPAEHPWPERILMTVIVLISGALLFFLWRMIKKISTAL